MSKQVTEVSLVLGSGGARGLAHIGVIRWIEEHNYKIVSVSGASVGALIGGIFASGKLDEFESWIRAVTARDIIRLIDISFERDGLIRGERIIETLRELIGDCLIEDLPMPFTAVASNLQTEKEVWLNSGSLFDAIRASISLPLFFRPMVINGQQLLDGGILNPVPIAPTFNDGSDATVAVNLGGKPDAEISLPVPPAESQEGSDTPAEQQDFGDRITAYISSLDVTKKLADHYTSKLEGSMVQIADRMFDTMQSAIARQQLAAYPPDVELVIPHNICGTFEFDRADELIQLGYDLAGRKLSKYTHP